MTDEAKYQKCRAVLARVMERQSIAAAICYEEERNAKDATDAANWKLLGRLVDGDIQNPFNEAIEQLIVAPERLEKAKGRVKEFVRREAELHDAGQAGE